jgi:hypothetical protein
VRLNEHISHPKGVLVFQHACIWVPRGSCPSAPVWM